MVSKDLYFPLGRFLSFQTTTVSKCTALVGGVSAKCNSRKAWAEAATEARAMRPAEEARLPALLPATRGLTSHMLPRDPGQLCFLSPSHSTFLVPTCRIFWNSKPVKMRCKYTIFITLKSHPLSATGTKMGGRTSLHSASILSSPKAVSPLPSFSEDDSYLQIQNSSKLRFTFAQALVLYQDSPFPTAP